MLPFEGPFGYNSHMILAEIQQYIEDRTHGEVIYPCYESYCLSQIPALVLALLGIPQPDHPLLRIVPDTWADRRYPPKVVLFVIDGFGWHQWLQYAERYDFFNRLTTRGVVAPLTTVFPSTTAAALTTIHSGLTPQEHGLPEWWVYFDELDTIAASLPFTPLGAQGRDKLLEAGVKPSLLFQGKTIYQTLAGSQIPSFTLIRDAYAHSAYSSLVHKGSVTVPFINASDLLVNLRQRISEVSGPAYFFVYWDAIDAIAHTYGPHTEQYYAELTGFSYLLQRELIEQIPRHTAANVLLMVTADHGHIKVAPRETLYLNRYPRLVQSLQVSRTGQRILPWGSPRDVFLRVQEERLPEIATWLTKRLAGKATVMTIAEAIQRQLFGRGQLHKRFKHRVGNLLILPDKDYLIWFEHLKGKKFALQGMHGGLRPEEMLIPLAAANLAALQ
jgi:predicted AlkP superfamily pyrophosphatase or phosphodiesterase